MKIKLNHNNTGCNRLARALLFTVYFSANLASIEHKLAGPTKQKTDSLTTEESRLTISATVIAMVCEDEVYNPHSQQQEGCS